MLRPKACNICEKKFTPRYKGESQCSKECRRFYYDMTPAERWIWKGNRPNNQVRVSMYGLENRTKKQ